MTYVTLPKMGTVAEALPVTIVGGAGSNAFTIVTSHNTAFTELVSSTSTAFNAATTKVRLFCDYDSYIAIGSAPVATATDTYLPAGVVLDFTVVPGDSVAVLGVNGAGVLYITEGSP